MITDSFQRVPLDQIKILREARQRREIKVEDLLDSISTRGVLVPVIISKNFELIAGERRVEASRQLGLPDIIARFIEDLDPIEAQVIELEENLKRKDLSWQDNCRAIFNLHSLYLQRDPSWTQQQTSKALGVNAGHLSAILRVYKDLDNPKIAAASSLGTAYGMLSRKDDREIMDVMSDILEAGKDVMARISEPEESIQEELALTPPSSEAQIAEFKAPPPTKPKDLPSAPSAPPESIFNLDFLTWAPEYSGKSFNFIHCDFPYGINYNKGEMSGKNRWNTYNDSPDVYWELLSCFCENLDSLMSHSAHLMFWYSMEYHQETLDFFAKHAPSLAVNKFPLVWMKSDNVGILPDAKRGPRRVYETCLIASREDRFVVKPVGNAYSAPTDKAHHPSTKPEPVLRHFMQMFVDENTRMLDPTCGSGSSLRAAESLGAASVLGLELDPQTCEVAKSVLRNFRALRKVNK